MRKEMKKMDPKIVQKPAIEFFNSLGKKIEEISFLGKGEGSAVYKIKTAEQVYCLKTALFPERSKKVLNEAKIRQEFIDKGLSFVPPPMYIDQQYFEYGAVFYDFIDGTEPNFNSRKDLSQMAKYLAEIHKLDYEVIADGKAQIWKNYQSLKEVIESIQKRYSHLLNDNINHAFSKVLEEYKLYIENSNESISVGISSILHGDVSDNCIIDMNGKLWLIDWENSEYGDVLDEIFGFVFYAVKDELLREFFYKEYKKHFQQAQELNFNQLFQIYSMAFPVFNICWGIDQLDSNMIHNLEPKRKLNDILHSARNWSKYFSKNTSEIILQGVNQMQDEVLKKL